MLLSTGQLLRIAIALVSSTAAAQTGDYLAAALRAGKSGVVEVVFAVDAAGQASDCAVIVSSGFHRLDHDACKTILATPRHEPAPVPADGLPIASRRRAKLRFAIDDAPVSPQPPN